MYNEKEKSKAEGGGAKVLQTYRQTFRHTNRHTDPPTKQVLEEHSLLKTNNNVRALDY